MRHAPAVGVTLSGGGAWRCSQVLLAGLSAATLAAWATLHGGWPAWPGALFVLLAAGLAWWATQTQPVLLCWDGAAWSADQQPGEVDLMLDLQGWLLLRWRPAQGRARWLAVPRSEAGAAWHGLRAALYSRAAFSPPPVAHPPARLPD